MPPRFGGKSRLAVEHELVGRGLEAVDGGLGEQGVGHGSQPLELLRCRDPGPLVPMAPVS